MYINQGNLTPEQKDALVKRNVQLFELIELDPKHRDIYEKELVENNIRLVSLVLKKYGKFTEDQFQTGCIGLIMAAKTFDRTKNVPFSSYATFLINRELQLAHKVQQDTIENQVGFGMMSLDDYLDVKGDKVSVADRVADELAEMDFMKCLDDFQLEEVFTEIIIPVIEKIGSKQSDNEATTFDPELWKKIEITLLMDMINIELVESAMTMSAAAKILNLSVQNISTKHKRVIKTIREEITRRGYLNRD